MLRDFGIETLEHLFFACNYTKAFWESFQIVFLCCLQVAKPTIKITNLELQYNQRQKREMMHNSQILIIGCRCIRTKTLLLIFVQ